MRSIIFCILLGIAWSATAQRQNGMIFDNYAGNISAQYNPANLADSRFRYQMNVAGFNVNLQNNYIQLEQPHSIYKFLHWKWDSTFGTQNRQHPFYEDYAKERLNGKDKYIFANASVNAFSMQFSLKKKSGFSFALTTKAYSSVSQLPENAIKTFLQDLDSAGYPKENQQRLLGQTISIPRGGFSALAYQQYSIKYAYIAQDKGEKYVKIGMGLDYNLGLYGGYLRFKDVNYQLTGIDSMQINQAEIELSYLDPSYIADPSRRLNDYFGKSKLGNGFGINGGIVYEHRPDPKSFKYKMNRKTNEDQSENKYDWKLFASITDLGFVNFKNNNVARSLKATSSVPLTWYEFDQADSWTNIDNVDSFMNTKFISLQQDRSFRMFTPASLHVGGEYLLHKNIYLSANYSQNLTRNGGKSVKMPSVLTVSPRYESRWLTVGTPLSISRYYNLVNIGAYVRGGIFYIGSDNLGGFFTSKKTNGANLYAGFNWPIHYRKLDDMDGDGISDDIDQCPNLAGTKYTEGCPDTDGDKLSDDEDECPNQAGSKQTNGCPDADGDKVADHKDLCPDVYGNKKLDGCPDSDGDGMHDGIDLCPDVAGEVRYKGCIEAPIEDLKKDYKESTKDTTTQAKDISKFDNWDFETYEYWPVLGAYNDIRWAEELQTRLNEKLKINTTVKSIAGVSKYYVTLGKAGNLKEAQNIQKILDQPAINAELNGTLWWKKVAK